MDVKLKRQGHQAPNGLARVPAFPAATLVRNLALSQLEAYVSGHLAGYVRYSMRGSEIWLLYLHLTSVPGAAGVRDDLIRLVLDDAGERRIAVHPYCPEVREYMRNNPEFLPLVPQEWRSRFRLPRG